MTTHGWLWLAFSIVGPLPLVWVWKWWRARRAVRTAAMIREHRRQKFGGCVMEPGRKAVTRLARPGPAK
jgi:hypothetical protein